MSSLFSFLLTAQRFNTPAVIRKDGRSASGGAGNSYPDERLGCWHLDGVIALATIIHGARLAFMNDGRKDLSTEQVLTEVAWTRTQLETRVLDIGCLSFEN